MALEFWVVVSGRLKLGPLKGSQHSLPAAAAITGRQVFIRALALPHFILAEAARKGTSHLRCQNGYNPGYSRVLGDRFEGAEIHSPPAHLTFPEA